MLETSFVIVYVELNTKKHNLTPCKVSTILLNLHDVLFQSKQT